MSLEKEDVRLKLSPDMKARLNDIAAFNGLEYNKQLTLLIEKSIVGEHHAVSVALERIERNKRVRAHEGTVVTTGLHGGNGGHNQILDIKKA